VIDLQAAAIFEIECLWVDFDNAIRRAEVARMDPLNRDREWSTEMEWLRLRITSLTDAVGSLPSPEHVAARLITEGWWNAIYYPALP
jgi:hypothetical protein